MRMFFTIADRQKSYLSKSNVICYRLATCIFEQFLESTGYFITGTCPRRARNYSEENQTRPLSFDFTFS